MARSSSSYIVLRMQSATAFFFSFISSVFKRNLIQFPVVYWGVLSSSNDFYEIFIVGITIKELKSCLGENFLEIILGF